MDTVLKWLKKDNYTLVLLFVAFWTPLIILFKLAGEVIEQEPIRGDLAVLNWLHSLSSPFLDQVFLAATNAGGVIGMLVIMTLLVAYLVYKRQLRGAVFVVAGVGGAIVANLILKGLFHRDRPSLFHSQVVETSFSFPSGHAMASSALVLSLILISWHTKWRWPVTVIGSIFMVAVGISRPYFGVHYPTDIIAGWCASAGWVLLVFFVIYKLHKRRNPLGADKSG